MARLSEPCLERCQDLVSSVILDRGIAMNGYEPAQMAWESLGTVLLDSSCAQLIWGRISSGQAHEVGAAVWSCSYIEGQILECHGSSWESW